MTQMEQIAEAQLRSRGYGKAALIMTFLVSLVAIIFLVSNSYQHQKRIRQDKIAFITQQTLKAKDAIQQEILVFQQAADQTAHYISENELSYTQATDYIEEQFDASDTLFSLAVAYTSDAQPDITPLVAPYYERLNGSKRSYTFLSTEYEDTAGFSWFSRPLSEGSLWTEPYFEEKNDTFMVSYSTPIYTNQSDWMSKQNPIGVVPTDVSLDYLTQSIKSIELGKTGFAMLFSKQLKLIAHPVQEYITSRLSFAELAQQPQMAYLHGADPCMKANEHFQFLEVDLESNAQKYIGCLTIPGTDWLLVSVYPDEQNFTLGAGNILGFTITPRQTFLLVISLLMVLCISGVGIISGQGVKLSALCSVFLIIASISIWWAEFHYSDTSRQHTTPIYNKTDMRAFVRNYESASNTKKFEKPLFIPTGVYLQSIEFRSASNVFITGYVWQKYHQSQLPKSELRKLDLHKPELHGDGEPPVKALKVVDSGRTTLSNDDLSRSQHLTPGIVFPEAVSANITEVYRQVQPNNMLTYGWYFESELRQPFDYRKYPFDIQHLWLRIWPKDFFKNVILVPDVDGYSMLSPTRKPGVANDVLLSGWELMSSQFNFLPHSYNENFGIKEYEGLVNFPELYYDVELQRQFLSSFITQLLPIVVISLLLFASVVALHKSDVNEVRNSVGALLFIILLSHFSLREHLELKGVVYLEYFYFILYGMISFLLFFNYQYFVSIQTEIKRKIFHKRCVLFFWPIYTGLIFAVTLITFVRT